MKKTSNMLLEIKETANVLKKQYDHNHDVWQELGNLFRKQKPYSFLTVARGSSDHAASFFSYLASIRLHIMSSSISPSLITLHETNLLVKKSTCLAISQSGQSPDLVLCMRRLKKSALNSVVMVNEMDSPLAKEARHVIDLQAGKEKSVAATKSYLASLFASTCYVLACAGQKEHKLFAGFSNELVPCDSQELKKLAKRLTGVDEIFVIGRGLGHSLANEIALKLQETCNIHALAYSGAEILHGPQSLIRKNHPLLILVTQGPEKKGLLELAKTMRKKQADVILVAPASVRDREMTVREHLLPELSIIQIAYQLYQVIEQTAINRGLDPDQPRHLKKITRSL